MTPDLSRAAAHAVNVWLIPGSERDRFVAAVGGADTAEDLPPWASAFLEATAGAVVVRVLPGFQFTSTGFTGV